MPKCYINITPDDVKKVAQVIPESFTDSIINLIPIQPLATYAPTKKKKYFRITFEIGIPEDVIVGQGCLTDFGGYLVLRLPKNRIVSKFLNKEEVNGSE
jgi:hypothetical protein